MTPGADPAARWTTGRWHARAAIGVFRSAQHRVLYSRSPPSGGALGRRQRPFLSGHAAAWWWGLTSRRRRRRSRSSYSAERNHGIAAGRPGHPAKASAAADEPRCGCARSDRPGAVGAVPERSHSGRRGCGSCWIARSRTSRFAARPRGLLPKLGCIRGSTRAGELLRAAADRSAAASERLFIRLAQGRRDPRACGSITPGTRGSQRHRRRRVRHARLAIEIDGWAWHSPT